MFKKRMTIGLSRYGLSFLYRCFKGPDYGKNCPDRDDGSRCMKCKYCKCEMPGYDATRLLESYGNRFDDGK